MAEFRLKFKPGDTVMYYYPPGFFFTSYQHDYPDEEINPDGSTLITQYIGTVLYYDKMTTDFDSTGGDNRLKYAVEWIPVDGPIPEYKNITKPSEDRLILVEDAIARKLI